MPKISVVIPVYNPNKEWFKQAVESILKQTYSDFELIIADDGSNKDIEALIRSFNDSRIKHLKLPHRGIASTINSGFDAAKGTYIARMDADDIALPDRFKIQVKFLDENPEYSIVGSNIKVFGNYSDVCKYPQNPKYFDFLRGCCMAHPSVMLRREDFDKYNLRYRTDILCEDYELWSRAIRVLKFHNIPKVLLKYRIHGKNLSLNNSMKKSDYIVRSNMINYLTNDEKEKQFIDDLIKLRKYNLWQTIFSLRNEKTSTKSHKIICIFGIKFKIKVRNTATETIE